MVKCCIPMCQNGLQAKNIAWKFQIWVRIQTALKERTRPLWMRTNTPSLGSDIIYVTDIRDHGESKIKLVRQREESQKIMEDKQARRRYARGNTSNPYQLTHFRISYYQPPDIAEVLAYTIIVEKWIMTHMETLDTFHCDQWKTHMYGSTWSNPDYTLTKPDSWSGLFWRKSDY